jgi:hypothetical protein
MDLGKVVENQPFGFVETTPSPPAKNDQPKVKLWADPPLLNPGGESFTFHFLLLF